MINTIKIKIRTLSNLFIGGTPIPFEIGGIDQWTAVDDEGFPCIPASSLKGAIRAIVMEEHSTEASRIAQWYAELLRKEWEGSREQIQEYFKEDEQAFNRIRERYADAIKDASAVYLFGIREFNNTPKLLFNDLRLMDEYRDLKKCFSIDTKTSINCDGTKPKSNPRIYKTARIGQEFEGEIELNRLESKYSDENIIKTCREYIIYSLKKFNDGVYRIGNSKSRGYGKIYVSIIEDGREDCEKL